MAKTIYCSFCARSNSVAGAMVDSSDRADPRNRIRVCLDCAKMAVGILERMNAEKKTDDESGGTKAKEKPTIDEEILALGKTLHPKLAGRLTRRRRPGVTSNEINKEFRYERVLIMQGSNETHEYKDDSLPLLKASLKRRLLSRKH